MPKCPMSRVICLAFGLAKQPVAKCRPEPILGLPNAQVPAVARCLFEKPDQRSVARCQAKPAKHTPNLATS